MRNKFAFLAGVASLAIYGCGGGDSGRETLAVVNGVNIPLTEYYRTMERKRTVVAQVNPNNLGVNPSTGRVAVQDAVVTLNPSMAFQALQECIANELIKQVAMDEGVYPKAEEIDAEIKLQEEEDPAFVKKKSEDGLTIDQIKSELALSLARYKLQSKGVTVTDAEVSDYIKQQPQLNTVPAGVEALYIVVVDPKLRAIVDKELKQGAAFASVAGRYTADPTGKDKGFKIRAFINQLPAYMRSAVEKTNPDSATPWLKNPESNQFYKFYVLRKNKATPRELKNRERVLIKRALEIERGRRGKDADKQIQDKLKSSKIEVKVKYLQEPWRKVFTELTKAKSVTEPGNN